LIELTWGSIGARILISKAWGDLEVPIEASDHQELLELLRSLRQREELSGMKSRRNQEIARALRGAARKDRGLELLKSAIVHEFTDALNDLRTKKYILMYLVSTEIEETIGQASWLWSLIILSDLKRKNI
jgi:hypothetical protein